jgi:hypothetical protein
MERFIVRPGIGLTVEYGEDHQVCEAIIEVPRPIGNEISENTPMDQNAANDVLEEIAPATARGNQVEDVWFQASCGVVRFTYYENLSGVDFHHAGFRRITKNKTAGSLLRLIEHSVRSGKIRPRLGLNDSFTFPVSALTRHNPVCACGQGHLLSQRAKRMGLHLRISACPVTLACGGKHIRTRYFHFDLMATALRRLGRRVADDIVRR